MIKKRRRKRRKYLTELRSKIRRYPSIQTIQLPEVCPKRRTERSAQILPVRSWPSFSNGCFEPPDLDESWDLRSSGVRSSNLKRLIFHLPIHSFASEYIPTSLSLRLLIHPCTSTSHSSGSQRSRRGSTFKGILCEVTVLDELQPTPGGLSFCISAI